MHRLRDALSEPEVNITENEVAKGGSGGMEANGPCLLVCRLSYLYIIHMSKIVAIDVPTSCFSEKIFEFYITSRII